LNVTTVAFNTVLQSQWKGCHNMLQHFLWDPLYTLPNSLFQVISICKICSHHQYWQDKFQGHHFWHVPKRGSLVLQDWVSSQARRCPQNGIWVCLETTTLPQCSAALISTPSQLQLQTPPYMTTVSVGAPHSRHNGFQIPETAWHFWHMCTSISMVI